MLLRMWDQDEKKLNKTFFQKPKALPESGLTEGMRRRRRRSLERSRLELGAGQSDRSRGEKKKG